MRDQTEWVETVDIGWNVITSANQNKIVDACERAMKHQKTQQDNAPFLKSGTYQNELYGDGHSAEKIVQKLNLSIE